MTYTAETVFKEFRHVACSRNKEGVEKFVRLLNECYDKVKALPIDTVKTLLPIGHVGYGGTYHKDWMIHECKCTKHYPFLYEGKIYDWYGDKTTTDIITSVANSKDDLYRRMLVQYIDYLCGYYEYSKAQQELVHIVRVVNEYQE